MFGFGQLIEVLKKSPKKIVFTEGSDPRILEASSRLLVKEPHKIQTMKGIGKKKEEEERGV